MAGLLSIRFKSCLALTRCLKKNVIGSPIFLQNSRKLSFSRKKSESAAIQPTKSEYEIEYEKLVEKEKFEEPYGFFPEDPYLDKATFHLIMFMGVSLTLVFMPMMWLYGPDFRSRMVEWRRYEASKLIEERTARGELPIDINFVPPELIESMVPPAGDWEEEWLRTQPAVNSKVQSHYYVEAPTW